MPARIKTVEIYTGQLRRPNHELLPEERRRGAGRVWFLHRGRLQTKGL